MIKVIPLRNGYMLPGNSGEEARALEITEEQCKLFDDGYLIWNDDLTGLVENTKREENIKAEEENLKRRALDLLRVERSKLLEAFDILKSNVMWGLLVVSENEKAIINAWYQEALDLNEEAIKNPPESIKKYLQ